MLVAERSTRGFRVSGVVQGVGFRPFVYRLAQRFKLSGWVKNDINGVSIEVCGPEEACAAFRQALLDEAPPAARIKEIRDVPAALGANDTFTIIRQEAPNDVETSGPLIPADLAPCAQCVQELFDSQNRRFRYPFINCTECGPRYSIVEGLPYERDRTSMRIFPLCDDCRREYLHPPDRRFHAEPNACPRCGPQLRLVDNCGREVADRDLVITETSRLLRLGAVVAAKGLGGFHLLVDATQEKGLRLLRERKQRPTKPFALLVADVTAARALCVVSDEEEELLSSAATPIVLLRRGSGAKVVHELVAPHNPYLGLMLPSTPLYHLLLRECRQPIVATSGNVSGEPVCIDNAEALDRLGSVADFFLLHNRPIIRAVEDSVMFVFDGSPMFIRRSRGYVPFSLQLPANFKSLPPTLCVGADLKNAIALQHGDQLEISEYIGDLDSVIANNKLRDTVADFQKFRKVVAERIVSDMHPRFHSTRFAEETGLPHEHVQHHLAHAAGALFEHDLLNDRALTIVWDGTGYGSDGTVWGGESFLYDRGDWTHYAQLEQFRLIGGDRAVVEPRRCALSLLFSLCAGDFGAASGEWMTENFEAQEQRIFWDMLMKELNTIATSSMGRLFDAVSSLLGLCQLATFEGEAAQLLEYAADSVVGKSSGAYRWDVAAGPEASSPRVLSWRPLIAQILDDLRAPRDTAVIARQFHESLAGLVVGLAEQSSCENIVLTGGCFQNRLLLHLSTAALRESGRNVFVPRVVPPGDGGIALGQAIFSGMCRRTNGDIQ